MVTKYLSRYSLREKRFICLMAFGDIGRKVMAVAVSVVAGARCSLGS